VQHADDHDLCRARQVIDGVLLMENHAQTGSEVRPGRAA
jgi:hypothetical protein